METAKARYQELCHYARDKKVRVLIETCGLLSDSVKMAQFIAGADEETRGVLWDIQHPYRHCKETPKQTVANLGKEIRYVHVKDSVVTENGETEYRMMGLGDLPVFDAVRELYRMGYDGYLTLEWLKRWRPELKDPDISSIIPSDLYGNSARRSGKWKIKKLRMIFSCGVFRNQRLIPQKAGQHTGKRSIK